MSHTPGPWTFDETLPNRSIAITANVGIEKIAKVADSFDNARLIAAAPDLLEALQDAEFLLRKLSINWKEAGAMKDSVKRSAEDARAAIAKAKGD